jgi:hypothetical protein
MWEAASRTEYKNVCLLAKRWVLYAEQDKLL